MSIYRVAALQMVSGSNMQENLASAQRLIARAAEAGAQLLVLPETFALFSARAQQSLGEQEMADKAQVRPFIGQQARQHGLWIVAGTIPMADTGGDRVYSASLVVNDRGQEVARYNKMHLFDVDVADSKGSYRESDTFKPGDDVVVVETPFGRLGLAVCYDIRFPELFRAMFARSVDIVAVPSAFTLFTGEAHWLALLRARAIESQCFIVGANQGGQHSASRSTSGGSVIIDGWGTVLAEAGRGECCVVADIDLQQLQTLRQDMQLSRHLRFDTVQRPTTPRRSPST